MDQINQHNIKLINIYNSMCTKSDVDKLIKHTSLDSIDAVMRKTFSIKEMRDSGSFFTGDDLATDLSEKITKTIDSKSIIMDPTCGAGNLLIACSRKLNIDNSLSKTLEQWSKRLRGYDLYPSFIKLTKLRLIFEAIMRGCKVDCSINDALNYFSGIIAKNALDITSSDISDITHTIMNPPFTLWDSPKVDYWNKGKVNAAAIIMDRYLRILPQESIICAILPEVLRSGARYEKWRTFIQSKLSGDVQIVGRFNKKTDVDVFIINGYIKDTSKKIIWNKCDIFSKQSKIEDYFDVSVGRLVAYRDPEEGLEYPYIHPKNLPIWSTVNIFNERRRFKGTVIQPPFVVIRRTSSPSDKNRAAGTIIQGNEPVAVENHLIIIKPKQPTLKKCKSLLKILKNEQTNTFLNDRIRCRHLTVGAVKQIPYVEL